MHSYHVKGLVLSISEVFTSSVFTTTQGGVINFCFSFKTPSYRQKIFLNAFFQASDKNKSELAPGLKNPVSPGGRIINDGRSTSVCYYLIKLLR